jgi:hypothetical protein
MSVNAEVVSILLLLRARGRMTAEELAAELDFGAHDLRNATSCRSQESTAGRRARWWIRVERWVQHQPHRPHNRRGGGTVSRRVPGLASDLGMGGSKCRPFAWAGGSSPGTASSSDPNVAQFPSRAPGWFQHVNARSLAAVTALY